MATKLDKARSLCKKMNVKYFCDKWPSGKRSLKPYDIKGIYIKKKVTEVSPCINCGHNIKEVYYEDYYKQPNKKEREAIKKELHIKLSKLADKVVKHRGRIYGYFNFQYGVKFDKETKRYTCIYYRYLFY